MYSVGVGVGAAVAVPVRFPCPRIVSYVGSVFSIILRNNSAVVSGARARVTSRRSARNREVAASGCGRGARLISASLLLLSHDRHAFASPPAFRFLRKLHCSDERITYGKLCYIIRPLIIVLSADPRDKRTLVEEKNRAFFSYARVTRVLVLGYSSVGNASRVRRSLSYRATATAHR